MTEGGACRLPRLVVCTLVLLAVAGCGEGGGGSVPPPDGGGGGGAASPFRGRYAAAWGEETGALFTVADHGSAVLELVDVPSSEVRRRTVSEGRLRAAGTGEFRNLEGDPAPFPVRATLDGVLLRLTDEAGDLEFERVAGTELAG